MRLLANENIPLDAVEALRHAGHDVEWVRTSSPGAADPQVIRQAANEGRILLTLDKDFGELVFKTKVPAPVGVVLLRFQPTAPRQVAHRVVEALASRSDWPGHFAVIEDDRVRLTPLPGPG